MSATPKATEVKTEVKPEVKAEVKPEAIPQVSHVQQDLAQASIDLYCPILDENGVHLGVSRVIVTQKAPTSGEALGRLMGQMGEYIKLGFSPLAPNMPRQNTQSASPSSPSSPSVPSAPGVPGGSASNPQGEAESGTWLIERFAVTPLPENNVKIEFFKVGAQQPNLKCNKWTVDRAVKMFVEGTGQAWTAEHFKVANQYNVRLNVDWKLGRSTGYGTARYRDVVKVALA